MRYLNIFVGGSIEGLEKERQEINELVHIVNVANRAQTLLSPTIERTFITVCSFSNFLGQMYQGKINNSIQKDVDCAIFLINATDASKKESCIGDFTKREISTVLENNIPYEIFIKLSKSEEDNKSARSAVEELINNGLDAKKNDITDWSQFYYSSDKINSVIPEILRRLTVKRVEEATWANDNFAYYTIEARMKEIYTDLIFRWEMKLKEKDKEMEEEKKKEHAQNKAKRTFEEFRNRNVYGLYEMSELLKRANECKCKKNKKLLYTIGRELSDITGLYKPTCYGEHHYEYIRRVPFLIAEFYFYYFILYQYLVEYDKCDDVFKSTKRYNPDICDPYKGKKKDKFTNSVNIEQDSVVAFRTLMSNKDLSHDNGRFKSALFHCVSTNSTDLSQLSGDQSETKVSNRLIIDHTKELHKFLMKNRTKSSKAAYILDNFGPEFISDILFGVYLIKCCGYTEIEYCVKQLPIFVSDTTLDDYIYAISDDGKLLETLNKLNIGHLKPDTKKHELIYADSENGKEIGRMIFRADPAWHRPQLFNSTPESKGKPNPFLRWNKDDDVKLIIVKGDMNYRRLVGDCNYDYFDTIEEKIDYIYKPLLILRSLKSNVILGVESICPTSVKPNWKTSGEYGIIHFIEKIQDTITERRRRCPKKSS